MRFNPAAFDRHVANLGQQVLWRSASACSCVNPDSGAPDPTCKVCHKKGWLWADPVQSVCGLTSQKLQREWAAFGLWESGDLVVTIPQNSPVWDSGQFDRLVMLNAKDRFSLPLKRGSAGESLSRFHVASISRVFWKADNSGVVVEGGIPTVASDGSLSWASNAPPVGTQYSITGEKYAEYFVWGDMPSSRNEHSGMRLPKKVVLRRWDLFGR